MHPDVPRRSVGVLFQANAELAEGPIWDRRTGCLYWVDIRRRRVCRLDVATRVQSGVWVFPARTGCIALTRNPGVLLVVAGAEVSLLDLDTGRTERLAPDRCAPVPGQ
jgi:sugar lactone lactonase YvrE